MDAAPKDRTRLAETLGLGLAMAAALFLAVIASDGSQPAPASAAPETFSAARAMADVRIVSARPHPIGSPANQLVRDHLLARLSSLGLADVQVRRTPAVVAPHRPQPPPGAMLENITAVLPGQDRRLPAVLLMSHYDSVPEAPGAGDAAAGVASVLEVVRALKAQGPLLRDVVVLFTDGEEVDLIGAEAWFGDPANRARVGAIVNLDSRGSRGTARMFRASPNAGSLVETYLAEARNPSTQSVAAFLLALMPNDTDLSVAIRYGLPGMDVAFIGGAADYHRPTDTAARLDLRTVQSLGDQVLPTVRALAQKDRLASGNGPAAYGDLFGLVAVGYSGFVGWLLTAAAAALTGLALHRRRPQWSRLGLLGGFGAGLLLTVASAAAAHLALLISGRQGLLERMALYEAAISLAAAAAALTVLWAASLRLRPWSLWGGLLVLGVVASVALQAGAPATATLLAWPALAASLAALLATLTGRASAWIIVLQAALVAGFAFATAHGLVIAVGTDLPGVLGIPALMAALGAAPLWRSPGRGLACAVVGAAGLVCALGLRLTG